MAPKKTGSANSAVATLRNSVKRLSYNAWIISSFLISNFNDSSGLIVLLSNYFSWKSWLQMRNLSRRGTSSSIPCWYQVPVLCHQPPCAQLFPPRDYLQIRGRRDITSAMGTDTDQSATNSPDLIKIGVDYSVTKLFAMEIYCLSKPHTSDMTDKEGRHSCPSSLHQGISESEGTSPLIRNFSTST